MGPFLRWPTSNKLHTIGLVLRARVQLHCIGQLHQLHPINQSSDTAEMKLVIAATTAVAAILVMSFARASAAPAEHSSDHGRRMLLSSPSGNTKPSESVLRWLLFRSRVADKEKAKNGGPFFQLSKAGSEYSLKTKLPQGTASSDEDTINDEDFSDDDIQYLLPEGRQAVKRQPDDYGHMRFGKRDFDDYGHMRFGRR